ncbi:MAG: leucine-rich repeat domain-containing protein [Ruminococcaceae bacterium]|nr:leucine-rich repeat domain-containing protein [Oscillospiraceae bacterium]
MKIKKIMLIVLAVSMFVLTGCHDGASLAGVKNKDVQSDLYLNMDAGSNDLILLSQQSKDNATLSNDNRSNANDNGRESAEIGDTVILDGVVYSKNMDTLISYPRDKSDKSYTVPSDVKHIADYAFASNPYVENVVFPPMAKTLGEGVFSGCTALKSVTFPFVTTEIGKDFFAASGVEEITIPGSVKVIRTNAFRDCKGLKKMIIPRSVTVIESFAFAGCTSLGEVEFEDPSFVPSGDSVFWGTPWYKAKVRYNPALWFCYVMKGEELILERYHGPDKSVSLPEGTTAITETAFMYSDIEEAELPASMLTHECTYIGADKKECTFVPKKNEALSKAFPDLKRFAVSENEQTECVSGNKFFEENGAVYYGTKENKVLYAYPAARADEFTEETKETVYEDLDGDGLIDIVLPSKTEYLKRDTFKGYTNVGTIYIPATLTYIPVFEIENSSGIHVKKVVYMDGTRSISRANDIGLGIFVDDSTLPKQTSQSWFKCDEVVIPASVKQVAGIENFSGLKKITLNEDNESFTIFDEVLYSADMTRLVAYPNGKDAREFAVPDGVIVIGESSFKYNDDIEKVSLPDSVTTIEFHVFYKCSKLREVSLSNNLTNIEDDVFMYSTLKELILPESITELSTNAFRSCDNLEYVYIPASICYIDAYAFDSCLSLLNVVFEDSTSTICHETAFRNTPWKNMQNAELDAEDFIITASDKGIVTLEKYLGNSESVVIPKGVNLIADDAFEGKKVTEVTFPASMFYSVQGSVFTIATTASAMFPYAVNYRIEASADLSEGIVEIDGVLYRKDFYWNSESPLMLLAFPAGKTGKYVFPENVSNYSNYSLASTLVEEFTFPEAFEKFELMGNFSYAPNLKRINLSSATEIGSNVYSRLLSECIYVDGKCIAKDDAVKETIYKDIDGDGLIDIVLPSILEYVKTDTFKGYESFGTLYIPASLGMLPVFEYQTGIKVHAEKVVYMDGIKQITALTIPVFGSPTYTANRSFNGSIFSCDEVVIPATVESIYYFSYFNDLKKITLQEGNNHFTLVDGVLYSADMTQIVVYPSGKEDKEFTVPETITSIWKYAFAGNSYIERVAFTSSISLISQHAFYKCTNLKSVVFPEGLEKIEGYAFYHTMVEKLIFPDTLETIGVNAFTNCKKLNSVYFPDSLRTIEAQAFKLCSVLNEVVFEDVSNVTIGDSAFADTPWENKKNSQYDENDFIITTSDNGEVILEEYLGSSEEVIIPEGVTTIALDAFKDKKVTDITLPMTLFPINEYGGKDIDVFRSFSDIFPYAVNYRLAGDVPGLTEIDGVLYNEFLRDGFGIMTRLMAFPAGRTGKYVFPENMCEINPLSINRTNLTEIVFPGVFESIRFRYTSNFKYIPNLESIVFASNGISERESAAIIKYIFDNGTK